MSIFEKYGTFNEQVDMLIFKKGIVLYSFPHRTYVLDIC